MTADEYNAFFMEHVQRDGLRIFSYIRPHKSERMWYLVGMDNGAVAQYDESRKQYWSFFRHEDVQGFLRSGRSWWVEVVITPAGVEARRWE